MFQTVPRTIQWVSIPILLIASLFACCAASYELLVDCVVCMSAIIFVQRAMWLQEYYWAAGCLAIGVVFTPLSLLVKIMILMTVACIATSANLLAVFRNDALPAA